MREYLTAEGYLEAAPEGAAFESNALHVRVTKFDQTAGFNPLGRLVKVTIEMVDEGEQFAEHIEKMGVPPEAILEQVAEDYEDAPTPEEHEIIETVDEEGTGNDTQD
jgi:hypothetical protein